MPEDKRMLKKEARELRNKLKLQEELLLQLLKKSPLKRKNKSNLLQAKRKTNLPKRKTSPPPPHHLLLNKLKINPKPKPLQNPLLVPKVKNKPKSD